MTCDSTEWKTQNTVSNVNLMQSQFAVRFPKMGTVSIDKKANMSKKKHTVKSEKKKTCLNHQAPLICNYKFAHQYLYKHPLYLCVHQYGVQWFPRKKKKSIWLWFLYGSFTVYGEGLMFDLPLPSWLEPITLE